MQRYVYDNVNSRQTHNPVNFLHLYRLGWDNRPEFSSNSLWALLCQGERGGLCDGLAFQMTQVKPKVSSLAKAGAKVNRKDKAGKWDGPLKHSHKPPGAQTGPWVTLGPLAAAHLLPKHSKIQPKTLSCNSGNSPGLGGTCWKSIIYF